MGEKTTTSNSPFRPAAARNRDEQQSQWEPTLETKNSINPPISIQPDHRDPTNESGRWDCTPIAGACDVEKGKLLQNCDKSHNVSVRDASGAEYEHERSWRRRRRSSTRSPRRSTKRRHRRSSKRNRWRRRRRGWRSRSRSRSLSRSYSRSRSPSSSSSENPTEEEVEIRVREFRKEARRSRRRQSRPPRIQKAGHGSGWLESNNIVQKERGAQSLRGKGQERWKRVKAFLESESRRVRHKEDSFFEMIDREEKFAGQFAVFYHSYSHASFIYELNSALAHVLFGFESLNPLPRLRLAPFYTVPDAKVMQFLLEDRWKSDGYYEFRNAGISAVTSLVSKDTEATPVDVWDHGYQAGCCRSVLDDLIEDLCLEGMNDQLCRLIQKYPITKDLGDVSSLLVGDDFGSNNEHYCKAGNLGRMLQIFIRRDVVDKFVYASHTMGHPDFRREDISEALAQNKKIVGQVRICANPTLFLDESLVKIFAHAADPNYEKTRRDMQMELR
eukprot:1394953-Amorphochlora_amoeboformis.AAC.1